MPKLDLTTAQQYLERESVRKNPISLVQVGPVRYHEKEMRCATRGCASSTHIKVEGIPRCMTHVIMQLNELVHVLRGGEFPENVHPRSRQAPDACESCPWNDIARVNYGMET